MQSNELTSAQTYDVNRMIFSKPIDAKIQQAPNSKRIYLTTINDDGKTTGDLILETPNLFSYGVQEDRGFQKGLSEEQKNNAKIVGYKAPLLLFDSKRGASEEEQKFIDIFNAICERCKEHLVENRKEIQKWDLEIRDLKSLNPIYQKRDKITGELEPNSTPTLYVKLMGYPDRVLTILFDSNDNDLTVQDVLNKRCRMDAAIKFESIFIGAKVISLQVKLYQAEITLQNTGMKRLTRSPSKQQAPLSIPSNTPLSIPRIDSPIHEEENASVGSISEDDYVRQPSPPRKSRGVARRGN